MQRKDLAGQDMSSSVDETNLAEDAVIAEGDSEALAAVMNAIQNASDYFKKYSNLENQKDHQEETRKNTEELMKCCNFILTRRYQNNPPKEIQEKLPKINFYLGYATYCAYEISKDEEYLNIAHDHLVNANDHGLIQSKYMLMKVLKKQSELDPKKKSANELEMIKLLDELFDFENKSQSGLGIPTESKTDLLKMAFELCKDEKDTKKIKSLLEFSAHLYGDIIFSEISYGPFYVQYGKILEKFGSPKEKKFSSLLYFRAFLLGAYEGLEYLIEFYKNKSDLVCKKIHDNLITISKIEKDKLISVETMNLLEEIIRGFDGYYNSVRSWNSKTIVDLRLAMIDFLVIQYHNEKDENYNYSVLKRAKELLSEIDTESDYKEEIEADLEKKLEENKALEKKNNSGKSSEIKGKKKKKNANVGDARVANAGKKNSAKTVITSKQRPERTSAKPKQSSQSASKAKQKKQTSAKSNQPQQSATKVEKPKQTSAKSNQPQQNETQKKPQQTNTKKKQTRGQKKNSQQSSKNQKRKKGKTPNVTTKKEAIDLRQPNVVESEKEKRDEPRLGEIPGRINIEKSEEGDESEAKLFVQNPVEGDLEGLSKDENNKEEHHEKDMEKSIDTEELEETVEESGEKEADKLENAQQKEEQSVDGPEDTALKPVTTIQLSGNMKFILDKIRKKFGGPVYVVGGQVRDRIRYSEKDGLKDEALEQKLVNSDVDIALPKPKKELGDVIYFDGIPFQKKQIDKDRVIYQNKNLNAQIYFSPYLDDDIKSLVKDARKNRDYTMSALYALYEGEDKAKVYDPTLRGMRDLLEGNPYSVKDFSRSMFKYPNRIPRLFDLYIKKFNETYPPEELKKFYHYLDDKDKISDGQLYYRLDKHFMSDHAVESFDLFIRYEFFQHIFPGIDESGQSWLRTKLLAADNLIIDGKHLSQSRLYMYFLAARIMSEIDHGKLLLEQVDEELIKKLMDEFRFPKDLQDKINKFSSEDILSSIKFIKRCITTKNDPTDLVDEQISPVSPQRFAWHRLPQILEGTTPSQGECAPQPAYQQQFLFYGFQDQPEHSFYVSQQQQEHVFPGYIHGPMHEPAQFVYPQYAYPQYVIEQRCDLFQHQLGQQEYNYHMLRARSQSQAYVQAVPPAPIMSSAAPFQVPIGYYAPAQRPYDESQQTNYYGTEYSLAPIHSYRSSSLGIPQQDVTPSLQNPCTLFSNNECNRERRQASSTAEKGPLFNNKND